MSATTQADRTSLALAIAVFRATMEARGADSGAWYFEDQNMTLLVTRGTPKAKRLAEYARRSPLFQRGCDRVKVLRVEYEK